MLSRDQADSLFYILALSSGYELAEIKHGGDLELSNRLTNTIMLGSLFVYQKFEGKGFGNVVSSPYSCSSVCLSAPSRWVETKSSKRDKLPLLIALPSRRVVFFVFLAQIMNILEGPIAHQLGGTTITLDTLTEDRETGEESKALAWCESSSSSRSLSSPSSTAELLLLPSHLCSRSSSRLHRVPSSPTLRPSSVAHHRFPDQEGLFPSCSSSRRLGSRPLALLSLSLSFDPTIIIRPL